MFYPCGNHVHTTWLNLFIPFLYPVLYRNILWILYSIHAVSYLYLLLTIQYLYCSTVRIIRFKYWNLKLELTVWLYEYSTSQLHSTCIVQELAVRNIHTVQINNKWVFIEIEILITCTGTRYLCILTYIMSYRYRYWFYSLLSVVYFQRDCWYDRYLFIYLFYNNIHTF